MSLSRRAGVALAGVLGASLLSGCAGRENRSLKRNIARVDGVEETTVEVGVDGGFGWFLYGDVLIDAADRDGLLEVFDHVMREAVLVLHDEVSPEGSVEVEWIVGRSSIDASLEVTPDDLGVSSAPYTDVLFAKDFFERYGIG